MSIRNILRGCAVALAVLSAVAFQSAFGQTRAALVRDVDRPSAQPANGTCSITSTPGGIKTCSLYTVPAGKRLKVEMVSYYVLVNKTDGIDSLVVGVPNPAYANLFPVFPNVYAVTLATPVDSSFPGYRAQSGSYPMSIYLTAGQKLWATLQYLSGSNTTDSITFSGYLVDEN